MPINKNNLIVLDFETDSKDPSVANPVQLSCLAIDSLSLSPISSSEFNSYIRPEGFNRDEYVDEHRDTIEWHAGIHKCSVDEILDKWEQGMPEKVVWSNFTEYLKKYHKTTKVKNFFSAPIPCGHNVKFDLTIINRLCTKYKNTDKDGNQNILFTRNIVDTMEIAFLWFFADEEMVDFKLDTLREYMGLPTEGAHDSLVDIRHTAAILCGFLKYFREHSRRHSLKGIFA